MPRRPPAHDDLSHNESEGFGETLGLDLCSALMSLRNSELPTVLSLALLGACQPPASSSSSAQCPDPTAPTTVVQTPDPDPGPSPTPPQGPFIRPADAFPIPSACEAPLAITQEVTRLLNAAAAHGTQSNACVDGAGQRLVVNDILACPAAPQNEQPTIEVFYQVVSYPETGRVVCPPGATCPGPVPTSTDHLVTLQFSASGADAAQGTLVLPAELPGFPANSTPLDQVHHGDCYGESPAFVPVEISLKR